MQLLTALLLQRSTTYSSATTAQSTTHSTATTTVCNTQQCRHKAVHCTEHCCYNTDNTQTVTVNNPQQQCGQLSSTSTAVPHSHCSNNSQQWIVKWDRFSFLTKYYLSPILSQNCVCNQLESYLHSQPSPSSILIQVNFFYNPVKNGTYHYASCQHIIPSIHNNHI